VAPGLRVIVEGRPNRFRRVGRPASLFAPKLIHPERAISRRALSRATEIDEGIVSRFAARLEADSYVVREASGALREGPGAGARCVECRVPLRSARSSKAA
jgi:hypothetical protein